MAVIDERTQASGKFTTKMTRSGGREGNFSVTRTPGRLSQESSDIYKML